MARKNTFFKTTSFYRPAERSGEKLKGDRGSRRLGIVERACERLHHASRRGEALEIQHEPVHQLPPHPAGEHRRLAEILRTRLLLLEVLAQEYLVYLLFRARTGGAPLSKDIS